jgi:hypothetical protein
MLSPPFREGHGGDLKNLRAVLLGLGSVIVVVVTASAFLPDSPRCPDTEAERKHAEVRDEAAGQERRAQCSRDSHHQDAQEAELLTKHHPGGRARLAHALREEQRQDEDVVDVGDGEQAHRLHDRPAST